MKNRWKRCAGVFGNNDREMSSVALGKSANESGKIRKNIRFGEKRIVFEF